MSFVITLVSDFMALTAFSPEADRKMALLGVAAM
jgi:hypothetical protein